MPSQYITNSTPAYLPATHEEIAVWVINTAPVTVTNHGPGDTVIWPWSRIPDDGAIPLAAGETCTLHPVATAIPGAGHGRGYVITTDTTTTVTWVLPGAQIPGHILPADVPPADAAALTS